MFVLGKQEEWLPGKITMELPVTYCDVHVVKR